MTERKRRRSLFGQPLPGRALLVQLKRDALRFLRGIMTADGRKKLRKVLASQHGGVRGVYQRLNTRAVHEAMRRADSSAALLTAAQQLAQDDPLRLEASRHYLRAGNEAAAEELVRDLLAARAKKLPPSLADGLRSLREAPEFPLAAAALDWSWRNLATGISDRTQWERQLRFAAASSQLLWDWLYCAPDRSGELDALIDPPAPALRDRLQRQNRGLLLIASHIGAPVAGIHHLCRSDLPVKLLGREPKTDALCNTDYLIDSENPYSLRDVRRALDRGSSVIVAAEAGRGRNQLEVAFPGNATLLVRGWIPRLLWRERIGSLFLFPIWQNGRIRISLTDDAPQPDDDETYPAWEQRWLHAYRDKLLAVMQSEPENLNLRTVFWRQFR